MDFLLAFFLIITTENFHRQPSLLPGTRLVAAMDDEGKRCGRCLSAEAHDDNITDYLTHFLGCIEFAERHSFLYDRGHRVWTAEAKHQLAISSDKSPTKAELLSADKQDRWRESCQKEIRRIHLLRKTLYEDKEDRILVQNVLDSSAAWRTSPECIHWLPHVQAWRKSKGKSTTEQTQREFDDTCKEKRTYEIEADVKVPIIQFENSSPIPSTTAHGDDKAYGVSGMFPDQKTTIDQLLRNKGKDSFLYRDQDGHGNRMKYIHIPANNMEVSLH